MDFVTDLTLEQETDFVQLTRSVREAAQPSILVVGQHTAIDPTTSRSVSPVSSAISRRNGLLEVFVRTDAATRICVPASGMPT